MVHLKLIYPLFIRPAWNLLIHFFWPASESFLTRLKIIHPLFSIHLKIIVDLFKDYTSVFFDPLENYLSTFLEPVQNYLWSIQKSFLHFSQPAWKLFIHFSWRLQNYSWPIRKLFSFFWPAWKPFIHFYWPASALFLTNLQVFQPLLLTCLRTSLDPLKYYLCSFIDLLQNHSFNYTEKGVYCVSVQL